MPRKPDPVLEQKIVAAAVRLLDRGGEEAVTLRAVAKEAGTTTPTIYERFHDRDELIQQVVVLATEEIVAAIQPKTSIEAMFEEYLRYCRAHPVRLNLTVGTFGKRYVSGEPMPAFDLLRFRISSQIGIKGRECEDLALAIASLAFGTAQGVIAAGKRTRHAKEFQRASLQALRRLLGAFQRGAKKQSRHLPDGGLWRSS
jgi:AcrR family transcriptional regulator